MRRLDSTIVRRAAAVSCICALSGTSGCAMMGVMRPAADSYTYDVGYASELDLRGKVAGVFSGLGYKDVIDAPSPRVHMETQWQERPPADAAERGRGSDIVSRIIVNGIPREAVGAPTMYHVLLTIENRYVPSRGTHRDPRDNSPACSYAQAIVKGMALAFGGSAHPVANEQPRPF